MPPSSADEWRRKNKILTAGNFEQSERLNEPIVEDGGKQWSRLQAESKRQATDFYCSTARKSLSLTAADVKDEAAKTRRSVKWKRREKGNRRCVIAAVASSEEEPVTTEKRAQMLEKEKNETEAAGGSSKQQTARWK